MADQLAHADETDALKRALRKWDKRHIQAFFQFAPLSKKEPVQDKLRARLRETGSLALNYALPAGQVLASPREVKPLDFTPVLKGRRQKPPSFRHKC